MAGGHPAYNRRGIGRCSRCGKVSYRSREEARAAKRVLHPGDKMHAYQCGDWWHFGHDEMWRTLREVWSPLPKPAVAQINAMAARTIGVAA